MLQRALCLCTSISRLRRGLATTPQLQPHQPAATAAAATGPVCEPRPEDDGPSSSQRRDTPAQRSDEATARRAHACAAPPEPPSQTGTDEAHPEPVQGQARFVSPDPPVVYASSLLSPDVLSPHECVFGEPGRDLDAATTFPPIPIIKPKLKPKPKPKPALAAADAMPRAVGSTNPNVRRRQAAFAAAVAAALSQERVTACFVAHTLSADALEPYEMDPHDPGRVGPLENGEEEGWDDGCGGVTVISTMPPTHFKLPPLPYPTRPKHVYQHLVYALTHRTSSPSSLSALIAYHGRFPASLRSARSYNVLIRLALRHHSFGTVRDLLQRMMRDGIQGDLETWKLGVRWLTRTGRWNAAWQQVLQTLRRSLDLERGDLHRQHATEQQPTAVVVDQGIPLPVWLELCMPRATRVFRRQRRRGGGGEELGYMRAVPDAGDPEEVLLARYEMLRRWAPDFVGAGDPLRVVHYIVRLMLRAGQPEAALQLTESYLTRRRRSSRATRQTQQQHDKRWIKKATGLINLHLAYQRPRWGEKAHWAAVAMLGRLLALDPALRPDSTTTLLVLRGLRQAQRCASVGWAFVSGLRRRYGEGVVDSRVRRRLAAYAMKEGRRGVLAAVEEEERRASRRRREWTVGREVMGGAERPMGRRWKWLLGSDAQLFTGRGLESRRWGYLRRVRMARFLVRMGRYRTLNRRRARQRRRRRRKGCD